MSQQKKAVKEVKAVQQLEVVINEKGVVKMKEENKVEFDVRPLVRKTNSAADGITRAETKLFDVIRECVVEMNGDEKVIRQNRGGIKMTHRSTVFVMLKVARNEFLMKLGRKLPAGWNTLYECSKLLATIGEDAFVQLIELGDIHN